MTDARLYNRSTLVGRLEQQQSCDVLVIGGGATGLGVALDAASRGLSTILFEQYDFAKGTSSRSTKLIHGGVRYLAQGDLKLVYNALHERDILAKNAQHLVRPQSFIIPCYSRWDILKYYAGLKLYDLLAGSLSFGRSGFLTRKKIIDRLGNITAKGLQGGIEYFDGQFDDARLAINIAQTAIEQSAIVLNYFRVTGIQKTDGMITGVTALDKESQKEYGISCKTLINATGVFVDDILKMDEPSSKKMVRPSQGVHVVINRRFLKGSSALMIPETSDGRVLFAVPWHEHILVGTTDTPLENNSIEPRAMDSEIKFILATIKKYLTESPTAKDVSSVFAGLRPLAATSGNNQSTKELSRDHKLLTSPSGMITITGGKWTTYRKMAEETVDLALKNIGFKPIKTATRTIPLHGSREPSGSDFSVYGTDEEQIRLISNQDPSYNEKLVNGHPYTIAEVVWAVRSEMARTVEDVLARRLRLLFLDANAAIRAAPGVAKIISDELGFDSDKMQQQLNDFYKLAGQYKLTN
jgi:glycerol-3-phosphate dehydrogenase